MSDPEGGQPDADGGEGGRTGADALAQPAVHTPEPSRRTAGAVPLDPGWRGGRVGAEALQSCGVDHPQGTRTVLHPHWPPAGPGVENLPVQWAVRAIVV